MMENTKRPLIKRAELRLKLNGYSYPEIEHARETLNESNDEYVSLENIRDVWERVSAAIDRHCSDENDLPELWALEIELSIAGKYFRGEN